MAWEVMPGGIKMLLNTLAFQLELSILLQMGLAFWFNDEDITVTV